MSMDFKNKMRTKDTAVSMGKAVGISLFLMFAVSGALLLLLAFLLYQMELGEEAVKAGIIVIYIISGIAGGFLIGKMRREKRFLWGLCAGVLYFMLLFLISCAVNRGLPQDMVKVLTTLVLCTASGMAGGMIS